MLKEVESLIGELPEVCEETLEAAPEEKAPETADNIADDLFSWGAAQAAPREESADNKPVQGSLF